MKKTKSQWKETLIDAIGEVVIALVLFGLGALVLAVFGVGIDAVDGDTILLIEVGVMGLLGGVVWVAEILKKKKKASDKSDENADNNDSRL